MARWNEMGDGGQMKGRGEGGGGGGGGGGGNNWGQRVRDRLMLACLEAGAMLAGDAS